MCAHQARSPSPESKNLEEDVQLVVGVQKLAVTDLDPVCTNRKFCSKALSLLTPSNPNLSEFLSLACDRGDSQEARETVLPETNSIQLQSATCNCN